MPNARMACSAEVFFLKLTPMDSCLYRFTQPTLVLGFYYQIHVYYNGISRFGLEKFLNLTLNFRIIFHAVGEKLYKDVSFSVVVFIARLCEIQGGVCC